MNSVQMSISSSSDIWIKIFWNHLCIIFLPTKSSTNQILYLQIIGIKMVNHSKSQMMTMVKNMYYVLQSCICFFCYEWEDKMYSHNWNQHFINKAI